MSEVPEVVVEHCNGVETEAEATEEANQNGDDGLAIDPKLGCRVHFPSDVIRETECKVDLDLTGDGAASCVVIIMRAPLPANSSPCTLPTPRVLEFEIDKRWVDE
ncbi:unnamed protein product [Spodoptera littoralis]|uniref:Uncharacterized protein n=1 Tax=Spodoptera littoralis TaxID=7109 RepID=A0A9P0MYZ8_SPOLI|nr:unnamed protein product [Spodoptera littoralis]CAH1635254.1 unnamed protein product [Spodoptera littoralis]